MIKKINNIFDMTVSNVVSCAICTIFPPVILYFIGLPMELIFLMTFIFILIIIIIILAVQVFKNKKRISAPTEVSKFIDDAKSLGIINFYDSIYDTEFQYEKCSKSTNITYLDIMSVSGAKWLGKKP